MIVSALSLSLVLAAVQAPAPGPTCVISASTPADLESCLGDEASRRALTLPSGSSERRRAFETAAAHYRRASDGTTGERKVQALVALAGTYAAERLNEAPQREIVLRELIAVTPGDPRFAFELAALQEAEGLPELAEDTLLTARRDHPQEVEVFRRLAQFYARRISALQGTQGSPPPAEPIASGERDADGVYRIGGQLPPPPRAGTPKYPVEAQDAGIQGGVQAEIVIDEEGRVADARVVRSVPLLDEAALQAVRQWRFEPTVVEGRPVPVRMIVTVNFTLSR